MKITRLNPKMTMSDIKSLLKKLPWCKVKMINGKTWLVRCGYVAATYPIIAHIGHASLLAV